MGITAHWIKSKSAGCWTLCSEVITFKGIAGAHNRENLGHYLWDYASGLESLGILVLR